jgi:hypothetical protein
MLQNPIITERTRAVTPLIRKLAVVLTGIVTLSGLIRASEQGHGVLAGTVTDVGSTTKTVVVKAADGTEHTFAYAEHTTVHGGKDIGTGTEDAFQGLEKGGKVAVHYTAEGGKETADEVDKIGEDGLKPVKVTVTHVDRGGKYIAVKTADGAKDSFRVTARASEEIGDEVAKGGEKAAKGTVYVTDEAGHKVVVHFF